MADRDETAEIPLSLIGEYPNRWESSTLGRACSLVTDGTHDSPKETQTGFPLVTGRCITGGRINLKAAYFISERDHKEVVARSKPEFGDILFANIGNSIGEMARVETNAEFSIKNVALFKPGPRLESLFLKYYLLSTPVQSFIRGNTFGSAQPFVGLGTLRAFPIPLPPLAEQKAIAAVLGALDDKIELNRRMNATLEAMARALFQSWFVDFDPVRAKLDGRLPFGIDPATAALFPASFTHEGDVVYPAGWRRSPVTEEISLTRGIEPGRDACNNEGLGRRFIRVGDVTGKRESDLFTNIETEVDVKAGEILVSFDGTPGAVSYTSEGVFSTGLRKPEGLKTKFHPCYLWCLVKSAEFQSTINEYAIGTTILHASAAIPHLRRVVASPEVMEAFGQLVDPIWKQLLNLHKESRTLATLRDTLLPKLLSGELRVAG